MRHRLMSALLLVMASGTAFAVEPTGTVTPTPSIVDIATAAAATISTSPLHSSAHMQVIGPPNPMAGYREDYSSSDHLMTVGVAVHEPVTLRLCDWPVDEFMYFLSGRVEITDATGRTRTYGPGDAIVMPRGFSGTWRQLEPIRKIALVYSTKVAQRPRPCSEDAAPSQVHSHD